MENKKIKDRSILEQAVKTIAVPDDYCNCSIQLEKTAVRNQMHSGRCWIESALDELEYKYFRDTGKRLPQLSAGFIQYYDLCLKVHIFLGQIFQTKDLPLDDPQQRQMCIRDSPIGGKGVSIGGVYHLDHNKTLILADGHLNEPALRVGDLLAGVQSVFHLVSQNCAQINGGNL